MKVLLIVTMFCAAFLCASGFVSADSIYDINYKTVGAERLRLDLHRPSKGTEAFPLVVMFHGGCFTSGDKFQMRGHIRRLTSAGFAVANVNYRLAPRSPYPAAKRDAFDAVRFLKTRAESLKLDKTRVYSYGWSSGGTLSLYVAAKGLASGAVAMSSRTDFLEERGGRDCAEKFLGFDRGPTTLERFRDASPLHQLVSDNPPLYLVHGAKDQTVLPSHATKLAEKARSLNLDVHLVIEPDYGHAQSSHALDDVARWLQITAARR